MLPFENLGDSADGYFADGMTDEVRGKLAALRGLQVIAHRSAAEYKGTTKSFQEIGRELGVDYLLVGKVRWEKADSAHSRVRVSPELIEVAGSTTRWQQPFDAVLSDVFQVQGEIAGKVAQALDVALGAPEQARLEERPTRNLAAYDAFLRGEEASKRMAEIDQRALERAAADYERAVALDSSFVQAWTRLSQVYSASRYANGDTHAEGAARARAAAERALALGTRRRRSPGWRWGCTTTSSPGSTPRPWSSSRPGAGPTPTTPSCTAAAALSEQSLGRWENALDFLKRAEVLDPARPLVASRWPGPSLAPPARRGHRHRRPRHRGWIRRTVSSTRPRRWRRSAGRSRRRPRRDPGRSAEVDPTDCWSPRSPTTGTSPGCWMTSSRRSLLRLTPCRLRRRPLQLGHRQGADPRLPGRHAPRAGLR